MVPVLIAGLILTLEITECEGFAHFWICDSNVLQQDIAGGQQYTWFEAYRKCKSLNGHLSTNTTGLSDDDKLKLQRSAAWTNKITLISKWMKIEGCYKLPRNSVVTFGVETAANCGWQCRKFSYFASDSLTDRITANKACLCLSQLPTFDINADLCFDINNVNHMTVFSRYNHTVINDRDDGNCLYNTCMPPDKLQTPRVASCDHGTYVADGVCDNGSPVKQWGLSWIESLVYCIKKKKVYFIDDFKGRCTEVTSETWTRCFRQEFTIIIQPEDEIDSRLQKCFKLRYHSTKYNFETESVECNNTLPYFICEKDNHDVHSSTAIAQRSTATHRTEQRKTTTRPFSQNTLKQYITRNVAAFTTFVTRSTSLNSLHKYRTSKSAASTKMHRKTLQTQTHRYFTVDSTMATSNTVYNMPTDHTEVVNKMERNESDDGKISVIGIIIGVVVAVVLLAVSICVLLFIYKKRHSVETKHRSGIKRQFHNEAYNDAVEETNSTHEAPGLQFSVGDSSGTVNQEYAVVQKTKGSKDVSSSKVEETFYESSNDDYDHLNEIDKRRIRLSENTYDSNVGLRNISDPTYDSSQPRTRMPDNHNGDYDNFSKISVVSSDDTYSVSYPAKINNKNDIYD